MNLQLSLKKKWFYMTDARIKPEDYRDINEYWIRRLTRCDIDLTEAKKELLKGGKAAVEKYHSLEDIPNHFKPKHFETNTVTLGYPKSTNTDRIRKYKHAGIEIRTGNPEWGALPNKLYFVIKHGPQITQ